MAPGIFDGIAPNEPYNPHLASTLLSKELPLKAYFVSLRGRKDPKLHEWGASGLDPAERMSRLEKELKEKVYYPKGIPHIAIAFVPSTSLRRWGDPRRDSERETLLYLLGELEAGKDEITLPEPPVMEACPAEAAIIAVETVFWARSKSVAGYMGKVVQDLNLSDFLFGKTPFEVTNPNKLREWLEERAR